MVTVITYPWHGSDHFVGEQIKVKAVVLENVLEKLDDLQGQHVLTAVIADFKNGRLPRIVGIVLLR
jgi:hypothetical protein